MNDDIKNNVRKIDMPNFNGTLGGSTRAWVWKCIHSTQSHVGIIGNPLCHFAFAW